ncbi:uncharacterized protein KIAA2026-like [Acyrthosiphon pisum]|uniref:Uncharacterized bromodomain-containing protein 10 helical domain-containing protein n=1 Tax=Acyrthosiphon pisum TaxID=7029 RepID=A0A8R2JM48_ACYPI|nr:uncharacterized protein KIAA2026-like [Acyrthosiphon pisum]
MWELPEIGNFLAIIFKKLDLDIINQGEIERMFLMPKESTTMDKVMSTLLGSFKTTKSRQLMPYKVWSKKLSKKVSDWCRVYHANNQNKVIALDLLGIHPDFWTVVNEKNPLIEKNYSELSYFIKVWLVKGLCDYITIKFKTINDIVTNCNARQCTIWKNDLETEEYFFFDSMPDLRIYYYNIPYDEPCLEFLESVKTGNELVKFEDKLTMNGFSEDFHMIQKRKHFKLIADSVESLRDFVYELNTDGKSVPENLISSLENFIVNIEPEEYNYIAMNNDSKIQLFKDWLSYMDKDNISVSEEKDSKSIAKTKNEELIIAEKRQRKLIVHQNVDKNDSDEYVSENDISLSDFTDSEDEWGAMNQPKFKVKQPQQAPSKLVLELEKQVTGVNKKLKVGTNNLLNTNQSDERNQQNIRLVSSKNVSVLKEKDSKSTDQGKNEELIIAEKRQRKLIVHQNVDTNDSDEYVSENDKSLSDFTDSEDEWGAINQPKFKVKQPQQTPSKLLLELEKRVTEAGKMLKYDTNQSDVKQLRYEDKISKRTHKMCKTNSKDKSIKSVKLLKTQNEGKICSNNTNTLPLVKGNNKDKQPLQTAPKHIKLQKQLREENTTLKSRSIKGFDRKDKNIKAFELLKTQNEGKICSNNTNTLPLVKGNNKDKQPLQTPKHIRLQKQLREENTTLIHGSLSDSTDSKDEWGAMNQPKFKVKQPQQTPSKLFLELEKQVTGVNKKLKVDTNNLLNTNQSDERNQQNITLVSSKNVSVLKEKDSKSTDQAKNEELIIAEKRQRKLIVHQNVDTNDSDEYVSENDKSLSDFTDSEDEWGAINQPKFKVKQPQQTPSKLFLELEKQVTGVNNKLKVDTNNLLNTNQSDERNQQNITLVSSKMYHF